MLLLVFSMCINLYSTFFSKSFYFGNCVALSLLNLWWDHLVKILLRLQPAVLKKGKTRPVLHVLWENSYTAERHTFNFLLVAYCIMIFVVMKCVLMSTFFSSCKVLVRNMLMVAHAPHPFDLFHSNFCLLRLKTEDFLHWIS